MSLLPKSRDEFSTKSYWEDFFAKRKDAFEWYGEYIDLCSVIHKYCKKTDQICMVGCGNSKLSDSMYDAGIEEITNIDISETVIKKLIGRENFRQKMKYLYMDIKDTTFENESFNVVFDKGTLDAIFTDIGNIKDVQKMFSEITRILKTGGRYICITLAQSHILKELLCYFSKSWFIRAHHIEISKVADYSGGLGAKLPVFALIFMKMKNALIKPVLELALSEKGKIEKYESIDDIQTAIENVQNFAIIQNKLESSTLTEEIQLDLWSFDNICEPRYTVTIIDTPKSELGAVTGEYGVFVVAEGHENEHTYSTKSGRQNLVQAAGFCRLAIITLHRNHKYESLDEIKNDLNSKMIELAPSNLSSQIPYIASSMEMGQRNIVQDIVSHSQGHIIVEDVKLGDGVYCRHLIRHLNHKDALLCKVKLMIDKSSKKKAKSKKRICDYRYISSYYQKCIFIGTVILCNRLVLQEPVKILCIGIKLTSFAKFVLSLFDQVHITLMEKDRTAIQVCANHFNLTETSTDRLRIVSYDDENSMHKKDITRKYGIIIIDILSESEEQSFLSKQYLHEMNDLLQDGGVLFLHSNMVPNEKLNARDVFKSVFSMLQKSESYDNIYILSQTANVPSEAMVDDSLEGLRKYINTKRPRFYEKQEWDVSLEFEN